MNDLLTVLVQTSPIPSHPSTALLQALFRSFDKVEGLKENCRIIILCDGCEAAGDEPNAMDCKKSEAATTNDNLKHGKVVSRHVALRYQQHLELLQSQLHQEPFCCGNGDGNAGSVELLKLPYRHGSAKAIEAAFFTYKVIQTPFVMIAQHDNFFIESVPLLSILNALQLQQQEGSSWLKCLHFISTATQNYIDKVQKRYGIRLEPKSLALLDDNVSTPKSSRASSSSSSSSSSSEKDQPKREVPLIPLVFWYGRTHIARTDYYTDFVLKRPLKVGDHLEELLGVTQLEDMKKLCKVPAQHKKKNGGHATTVGNTSDASTRSNESDNCGAMKAQHDKVYGNYVLDHQNGREVLYHLSGRRARAVKESRTTTASESSTAITVTMVPQGQHDKISHNTSGTTTKGDLASTTSSSSSWTIARSCRAVVPGLQLIPTIQESSDPHNKPSPSQTRFRQRCFHCGIKGHSYKFCPALLEQQQRYCGDDDKDGTLPTCTIPNTKTIDL